MTDRLRLDAELENLERMLPLWRASLRHEAQFRPQFDVLAREIVEGADAGDREHARARIAAMLAAQLPSAGRMEPLNEGGPATAPLR